MKSGDVWLQQWRYSKAKPFVEGLVLDVGCYDGSFLEGLDGHGHEGIDIQLRKSKPHLHQGELNHFHSSQSFDTITCLATYEHFDEKTCADFWQLSKRYVTPFGRVVMTVPHPLVDTIIHVGKKLGILDGMDDHQHRSVKTHLLAKTAEENGFSLVKKKSFQFGLNRLYVFEQKERPLA